MKLKMMTWILVLTLTLTGACCALAETADGETEIALPNGQALPADTELSADLNGDGTDETVSWTMAGTEDTPELCLTVKTAAGDALTYTVEIMWAQKVYLTDIDGDGTTEILLTGDTCSDDYATWCVKFDGSGLYDLLFADVNRGGNGNGYFNSGYGMVTAVGEGVVTLTGSQDVLGTFMASRTFSLSAHGRFELNDGGLWSFPTDLEDADTWEYRALTLKAAIPVTFDTEGTSTEGTLEAGDKFVVTASDKTSIVYFMTQDGRSGSFAIEQDYEKGWGFRINDLPEDDLFEYVPYAD